MVALAEVKIGQIYWCEKEVIALEQFVGEISADSNGCWKHNNRDGLAQVPQIRSKSVEAH